MKLGLVIQIVSIICFSITTTTRAVSLSSPNCQEKCGNVTIPYPFGIGAKCSANSSFTVICQNSTTPPKPFLSSLNLEVLDISLYGAVKVNLPVSPMNCSDGLRTQSLLPISLKGGPFSIAAHYNSLLVMGCNTSLWLHTNATTVAGCTAVCGANSMDTSCNGVNCCQVTLPRRLQELEYTYQSFQTRNSINCGYVLTADKQWLQNEGLVSDPFDRKFGFAPLVLEWEFANQTYPSPSHRFCKYPHDYYLTYRRVFGYISSTFPDEFCRRSPYDHRCQSLLSNFEDEYRNTFYYSDYNYVSSSRYCSCEAGFEGNPYIVEGCRDIDECSNATIRTRK